MWGWERGGDVAELEMARWIDELVPTRWDIHSARRLACSGTLFPEEKRKTRPHKPMPSNGIMSFYIMDSWSCPPRHIPLTLPHERKVGAGLLKCITAASVCSNSTKRV
jgi:hypothetical protein